MEETLSLQKCAERLEQMCIRDRREGERPAEGKGPLPERGGRARRLGGGHLRQDALLLFH